MPAPRTRIRPQGPASPMPAPIRRDRQRLLAGRSVRAHPATTSGGRREGNVLRDIALGEHGGERQESGPSAGETQGPKQRRLAPTGGTPARKSGETSSVRPGRLPPPHATGG